MGLFDMQYVLVEYFGVDLFSCSLCAPCVSGVATLGLAGAAAPPRFALV
jgi:hypothetical protein